jgi:hypothetical protein
MAARLSEEDTTKYLLQMFFDMLHVEDLKDTAAEKIAKENLAGEELDKLLQDIKELDLALEWKFRAFRCVYPEITGEEAVRRITPILEALQQRNHQIRPSVMDLMRQQFNENIEERTE